MSYLIKTLLKHTPKNNLSYGSKTNQQFIIGVRYLFNSRTGPHNQDHTNELLTSYKQVPLPKKKSVIESDDYDLLACPPENLIHPSKENKISFTPQIENKN